MPRGEVKRPDTPCAKSSSKSRPTGNSDSGLRRWRNYATCSSSSTRAPRKPSSAGLVLSDDRTVFTSAMSETSVPDVLRLHKTEGEGFEPSSEERTAQALPEPPETG